MTALVEQSSSPALSLIRDAMAADVSPEKLSALLAVKQTWEADEARKAFNLSIAEFQRNAPIIEKGDVAHEKQYARMDRIWRTVRKPLTDLGLSVTWQVCELRPEGICHVEGMLRHRDGHGERLVMDIPLPEIIRGQNKSQQMGSARTYAQRYAFCSAVGLVTGDDDDDGNGGAVDPDEAQELATLVDACRGLSDWNEKKFWEWAKATSPENIPVARMPDVLGFLKRKIKEAK